MICHDHGTLTLREDVAGNSDDGPVLGFEQVLDPSPGHRGDVRREVVHTHREEEFERKQKGEKDVGGEDVEQPRGDQDDAPDVREHSRCGLSHRSGPARRSALDRTE
jgi:hypothetical protein